ncbi:MAG: MFS transporter [Promethearchaeota archaeon]|nr:MAG: MFS transporter [Candidatus Lokiarchaeota archaeon]
MSQVKQRKQFKNPIWGLGSFQALAMFRRGLFYTFLSIYMRNFLGLSVTATTLYATIPMILSVIGQNFIWGPLSDKIQKRRTLMIIGEVVAGILLTVVWYLHTIPSSKLVAGYIIIIGLTVIELFWSMSNIGWSALISDLYPSKTRSKIMGWLNSIGGVGRIIGATIGGLLYGSDGWQYEGWGFDKGALFIVASGIMLLSTIPMFFTQEGGKTKSTVLNEETSQNQLNDNPVLTIDKKIIHQIYLIFVFSMVFINFGRNSIATIQSQYLTLETGFAVDSITLSYIANVNSIAVILFGIITGWVCKKIGEDNALLVGALVGVLSLIIYSLPVGLPFIYGANIGQGISELVIYASSYMYVSKLIPYEKRARLFALYNATFFLSWGLSGTVMIGPIVDLLLNRGHAEVFAYRMSFVIAAGITLIGLVMFFGLVLHTRKLKIRKEIINLF